ncbi:sn-glycerol-3-phosphate ABC transporter ATP-binding protein UgpC [Steroidobacter sp. S1-65]|uniref:Sn-glycerol-3-phosphate ABC transporter ATP-binding protein UgpC n=1 Tax=Steroidobacter gossypii TaxID=2805490 RepID=A0ABS1X3C4_9GAMM|nr:sn-glycerol-3-phosphate ABC transporter ATP-binding protein UgpC [Steroidobacter gossypii]MBM0107720.1 sn-glycerol-3-phosphate ABC transporter ATP-binding protein UgpC [Steroidobacter gossypii]
MPGIELKNLIKTFGAATVIDNVSLSIRPHEFMVFLGPSGCGKSTLLRMIAGLESVDAGEIWIGDRRVDQLAPGERRVAMVFQHYALYPHMTVRENMSFGLRNVRMPTAEIDKRVAAAARMLEIEHLLERKPGQISGGQRQRVAIGRAIVKEPHLFLFDEPLSNLDAALRVRTRIEIAQLHQRVEAAMIFVTHDQVEAMTLAHRIVVMNNRKIEQIGTPMEIYSRPATAFVAGFVGTPAMNFAPVELTDGPNGFVSARLPDGVTIPTRIEQASLPGSKAFKLGIRAESLRICGAEQGDTAGVAQFVERLGDRTLVYVRLSDGTTVVAEDAGTSRVALNDSVGVKFDGACAHLFDDQDRGHHAVADVGS